MTALLQLALDAHGGLDRWRQWGRISANISIGGQLWQMNGRPGFLSRTQLTASLQEQRVEILLPDEDRIIVFTPERVTIRSCDGHELVSSGNPRDSFANRAQNTPWSDVEVGYFNGYALWQYLTAPFLYASPGFETEEEAPWEEDGEIWRVLRIAFPDHVTSHTRLQRAYYGPDGLLRRHQYSVDVLGGAQGVNYASDFHVIGGIMMPMKRRVYAHDAHGRKIAEPVLVSIDIHELQFH